MHVLRHSDSKNLVVHVLLTGASQLQAWTQTWPALIRNTSDTRYPQRWTGTAIKVEQKKTTCYICLPSLMPMLGYRFESCLWLGFSGFHMWHVLKHTVYGFLCFFVNPPPPFHWLMVSVYKYAKNKCDFIFVSMSCFFKSQYWPDALHAICPHIASLPHKPVSWRL